MLLGLFYIARVIQLSSLEKICCGYDLFFRKKLYVIAINTSYVFFLLISYFIDLK